MIAKGTKFAKSNLQGCRFYKAYLVSISCLRKLYACPIGCFQIKSDHDSLFLLRSMLTFPMPTCVVRHLKIQAWMERPSKIQTHVELTLVKACWMSALWKTQTLPTPKFQSKLSLSYAGEVMSREPTPRREQIRAKVSCALSRMMKEGQWNKRSHFVFPSKSIRDL